MINKILYNLLTLAAIIMFFFGSKIRPDWTEFQIMVMGILVIIQANTIRIAGTLEERK